MTPVSAAWQEALAFFTSPAWGPAARSPVHAPAALHAMLRPGPQGRGYVMSMDSRFLLAPESDCPMVGFASWDKIALACQPCCWLCSAFATSGAERVWCVGRHGAAELSPAAAAAMWISRGGGCLGILPGRSLQRCLQALRWRAMCIPISSLTGCWPGPPLAIMRVRHA